MVKPLLFPIELHSRMRRLGEAAYPYEGCGVLIGVAVEGVILVSGVVEGHNLVQDRRRDRYELDPRDILNAEREARSRGHEVAGFFHTHPDHPARPSQFDTERAWPGYDYVVIAVDQGRFKEATAWRLEEGEGAERSFGQVPLQVAGKDRDYNPPGLVAEAG